MDDEVSVAITADTQPFRTALRELEGLSRGFGAELGGALRSAVVSGKDLEDVLRQVGLNLAGMALSQGMKPLQGLASSLFQRVAGGLGGAVLPFAKGGVVAQPSYFPAGNGRTRCCDLFD